MEAVRTIPAGSAVKFIKGLVSRFGVPNRIITDNGSQFTSNLFKTYCANLGTQICYASVAHPRSNGQAECANAEVLRALKTRTFKKKLEACGRGWYDELQSVLWSIRTNATKPTGETPPLPSPYCGPSTPPLPSQRARLRSSLSTELK